MITFRFNEFSAQYLTKTINRKSRNAILLLASVILIVGFVTCNSRKERKVIREYFASGALKKEYEIIDDQQTGKEIRDGYVKFYSADGILTSVGGYRDGRLSGAFIYYYPSGLPRRKVIYVDGKLNGEINSYYENGKLKSSIYKVDRLANDTSVFYYDDGHIMEKDLYANGNVLYSIAYDKPGKIERQKWHAEIKVNSDSIKVNDSFRAVINIYEYNRLKSAQINLACVPKVKFEKDSVFSSKYDLRYRVETVYKSEIFRPAYIYKCKASKKGIYYLTGIIEYKDPTGKENWTEVKHRFIVY